MLNFFDSMVLLGCYATIMLALATKERRSEKVLKRAEQRKERP